MEMIEVNLKAAFKYYVLRHRFCVMCGERFVLVRSTHVGRRSPRTGEPSVTTCYWWRCGSDDARHQFRNPGYQLHKQIGEPKDGWTRQRAEEI